MNVTASASHPSTRRWTLIAAAVLLVIAAGLGAMQALYSERYHRASEALDALIMWRELERSKLQALESVLRQAPASHEERATFTRLQMTVEREGDGILITVPGATPDECARMVREAPPSVRVLCSTELRK